MHACMYMCVRAYVCTCMCAYVYVFVRAHARHTHERDSCHRSPSSCPSSRATKKFQLTHTSDPHTTKLNTHTHPGQNFSKKAYKPHILPLFTRAG